MLVDALLFLMCILLAPMMGVAAVYSDNLFGVVLKELAPWVPAAVGAAIGAVIGAICFICGAYVF